MSKADGEKKYCKKEKGKGFYIKIIWIFILAFLLISVSVMFVQKDRKANIGDVICERIKEEIPISEMEISNDGDSFFVRAKSGRREIFAFLKEKLGSNAEKLRFIEAFLPEEIRLSCRIILKNNEESGKVCAVITHMSLNEYEIPAAFLENIGEFPLILKDFYSIIDA